MEWEFTTNYISDVEAVVEVYYNDSKILVINSIDEGVNFFDMDMLDIEDYLINHYEEDLEIEILDQKRKGR